MPKIVVGPFDRGLRTDRTAFVIDNDSFPTLINAYQWRGRVKRKRGTKALNRLQRFLGTTDGAGALTVTILPAPIAVGVITVTVGTDIFTDPGGASPVTLITNGTGSAVLDRATGILTITGSQIATSVLYYPSLPVMGLEDLVLNPTQFPGTLAFDTDYAYNILTTVPYNIYDVSFYKNPLPNGVTLPGYVPKILSNWTTTSWNGQNYQQFWTVNYQGALWATNGIATTNNVADVSNIGMQFAPKASITYTSNTSTTLTVSITNSPLVVGDFVFANEWTASTAAIAATLNFQTGYVTAAAPNTLIPATKTITITFPFANIGAGPFTPGILQYLTNRSDTTKDVIRWYDGDPTNANPTTPTLLQGNGWVNFMPPLSQGVYSIADLPPFQYYLVGARLIFPFKDRLLFFGAVVQSSTGAPIYLQDTIVYSQNGTPYYTASFTGLPVAANTVFNPILVPTNQIASAAAWFEDQTGFGGFITAGVAQAITTVGPNEDVLIVGFSSMQTRLVYTGNDIIPFAFYIINSELGSGSTFSSVVMDKGVFTRGTRGIIITSQTGTSRTDDNIPDQVFQFSLQNNGSERVCSQRDYESEWIYLTYPSNEFQDFGNIFPNQTLQYNYRDNSWAVFNENYTTYGLFRPSSGYTWNNIGYSSWKAWQSAWNSGVSTIFQQQVIAGNQQGFVVFRDNETNETPSLTIQNIVGSTVTSPNHSLNDGDFIYITGVLGTVAPLVNDEVFKISPIDANNFTIISTPITGTYLGGGLITRLYIPQIQTKQFPMAWEMGRKTRLGPQMYLFTKTSNAEVTLQIFLSQDAANDYNAGPIVPDPNSTNDSLIYTTVLFTCPESTNLGLTFQDSNLNTPTAITQGQLWHRMNTSLIGDTVQIGITLSDEQMLEFDEEGNFTNQFAEIELHGFILDANPSQLLV